MSRRLIPAGAGNTWPVSHSTCSSPAHPRGCGEHGQCAEADDDAAGSSPRVRGTQRWCACRLTCRRLIPAGAGNTPAHARPAPPHPAHPRGCGEHAQRAVSWPSCDGSSPRVRGTQGGCAQNPWQSRLIPAGAGNTGWGRSGSPPSTAHPRGCGEHNERMSRECDGCGSSPRVRGTRQRDRGRQRRRRLIPAGAGNTAADRSF